MLISLRWKIIHDSPLLLYAGFLMDRFEYVPYKDFFEMNPPGTFLVNRLLFQLVGFSDLRFRIVDTIFLAILSYCSWFYLRALTNTFAALTGVLLFAITYLATGPAQSMQREYIALLPIMVSLIIAFRFKRWSGFLRSFLIGILLGFVSSIKPHLSLALPVILGGMIIQEKELQKSKHQTLWWVGELAAAVSGFLLFISAILLYLKANEALNQFLEIATQYWPLYSQLDGAARIRFVFQEALMHLNTERLFEEVREFRFYGLVPLGIFFGFYSSQHSYAERIEVVVLHLLALCFLCYIWIGNKYWIYHDFPLFLILSFIAGFSLWFPVRDLRDNSYQVLLMGTIILVTVISLPITYLGGQYLQFFRDSEFVVKSGNVDKIASFLEKNMLPEDRVLPLDVTGGAIHAMYRTQARLGSSFIYDFHFYHHCDSPYIQTLRKQLIQEINTTHPKFVIQFDGANTWRPHGQGTCQDFPALKKVLQEEYHLVLNSPDFEILERYADEMRIP
jgi:MFS family permease